MATVQGQLEAILNADDEEDALAGDAEFAEEEYSAVERQTSYGQPSLTHFGSKPAKVYEDVKRNRKQVNVDIVLMKNRLRHLEMEDAKAKKKISETQKRSEEIRSLKQRNQERQHQRQLEKAEKDEALRREAQRLALMKAERKAAARANKDIMLKDKRDEVRAQREASKYGELECQRLREMELEKSSKTTASMRIEKQLAAERKISARQRQHDAVLSDYESKIAMEQSQYIRGESEMRKLELEEKMLINRLRKTQEEHLRAYQELESVLLDNA